MKNAKPVALGNVWTASAKLYNEDGKLVGCCMDAPNPIPKAMMEHPEVTLVKSLLGLGTRRDYADRMNKHNTAASCFIPKK